MSDKENTVESLSRLLKIYIERKFCFKKKKEK